MREERNWSFTSSGVFKPKSPLPSDCEATKMAAASSGKHNGTATLNKHDLDARSPQDQSNQLGDIKKTRQDEIHDQGPVNLTLDRPEIPSCRTGGLRDELKFLVKDSSAKGDGNVDSVSISQGREGGQQGAMALDPVSSRTTAASAPVSTSSQQPHPLCQHHRNLAKRTCPNPISKQTTMMPRCHMALVHVIMTSLHLQPKMTFSESKMTSLKWSKLNWGRKCIIRLHTRCTHLYNRPHIISPNNAILTTSWREFTIRPPQSYTGICLTWTWT